MSMFKQRWFLALVALALLVSVLPAGQPAVAQTDSRTFTETGKTVSGKILAYWNATAAWPSWPADLGRDAGRVGHRRQDLHRAVFRAGRVGDAPRKRRARPMRCWRAARRALLHRPVSAAGRGRRTRRPAPATPITFKETGKTLGGKFRAYWDANGGLAPLGYPITDEFQEKSDARRQDLHRPVFRARRDGTASRERGTPVDVLLAQLGTYAYRAKTDLSFTDSTGTTVTLKARPQRIVCLVSLCEDILYELGLEPVAVSDKFYQLPEFWGPGKTFGAITGGFGAPNLEDIAKSSPTWSSASSRTSACATRSSPSPRCSS